MRYNDLAEDGTNTYLWILLSEWSKRVNSYQLFKATGLIRIEDFAMFDFSQMVEREEIVDLKAQLASA